MDTISNRNKPRLSVALAPLQTVRLSMKTVLPHLRQLAMVVPTGATASSEISHEDYDAGNPIDENDLAPNLGRGIVMNNNFLSAIFQEYS
jgi:hypothetical protein